MGQYYVPVLISSRRATRWLYSHEYNNGLKLMEHSYMGNKFVNAVLSQIVDNPQRVGWVGDYAMDDWPENFDERDPYQQKLDKDAFEKVYRKVWDYEKRNKFKIHPVPLELRGPEDFDGTYLINHDKRLYVDLGQFAKENGWWEKWNGKNYRSCIHPLPLLTACGNGRGGGDYWDKYPDYDKVGIWAFDKISFSSHIPDGFSPIMYHFKEDI